MVVDTFSKQVSDTDAVSASTSVLLSYPPYTCLSYPYFECSYLQYVLAYQLYFDMLDKLSLSHNMHLSQEQRTRTRTRTRTKSKNKINTWQTTLKWPTRINVMNSPAARWLSITAPLSKKGGVTMMMMFTTTTIRFNSIRYGSIRFVDRTESLIDIGSGSN